MLRLIFIVALVANIGSIVSSTAASSYSYAQSSATSSLGSSSSSVSSSSSGSGSGSSSSSSTGSGSSSSSSSGSGSSSSSSSTSISNDHSQQSPEENCETPLDCCENEEFNDCANGGCFGARNCSEIGIPIRCVRPKICKGGCLCKDGYLRNAAGDCIPENQCGKTPVVCKENEVYSSCFNGGCYGPRNCSQKGGPTICVDLIEGACKEGCLCKDDYLRNDENICVPPDQCPPKPVVCKENEVYSGCINGGCYGSRNCSQIQGPIICVDLLEGACIQGCLCKDDYLRNDENICVPPDQCPPKLTGNCTKPNEIYQECPPSCPPGICGVDERVILCAPQPQIGDPKCPPPECRCASGFYRNNNGDCVTREQCNDNVTCKANEIYDVCPTLCPPRTCGINDLLVDCAPSPRPGDPDCLPPKCRCQDGFYRNDKGACVTFEECPTCNQTNEVYDPCIAPCPPRRCGVDEIVRCKAPPQLGDPECVAGCRCADDFTRNDQGVCVTRDQCNSDQCPGDNEFYDPCPKSCSPETCDSIGKIYHCPIQPAVCKPACRCITDYFRNSSGVCIPKGQCNATSCNGDPNAEPGCGVNCGHLCSNYNSSEPIACPDSCIVGGCDCKPGFAFDEKTGKCVLPQQCTSSQCTGINEMYVNCTDTPCLPKTCAQLGFPQPCNIGNSDCSGGPGCICNGGYLRNDHGVCKSMYECPSCGGDPNAQAGCGVNCGRLCSNYDKGPSFCPLYCKLNGCDCKPDFVFNSDTGKCVDPLDCPPLPCGENEEFNYCANGGCFGARNCSEIGKDVRCVKIDPKTCKRGCVCVEGFLRDAEGKCIPEDQCGNQCLGPNEVFDFCPKPCSPETCDSIDRVYDCPIQPAVCKPACRCITDHFRNSDGVCIPKGQCNSTCNGDPNASPGCGVNCGRLCSNYNSTEPVSCILICKVDGCDCNDGYVLDETTGKCVLPQQCTPRTECPDGEVYNTCPAQPCDADYCPLSRDSPQACKSTKNCGVPRCTCGFNQKRDRKTNQCIPTSTCPPFECNCANEEYNSCPPLCPGDSCEEYIINATCPYYFVNPCNPACRCSEGYYRNSKGICVSACECLKEEPISCKGDPNAKPGCGINCGRLCSNYNSSEPVACIELCKEDGCDCKDNYVLNEKTGMCVLPDQCYPTEPTSCNGDPNAQPGCGINCGRLCSNYNISESVSCIQVCYENACDCKPDYVLDEYTGKCVLPEDCIPPDPCGTNEEYSTCLQGVCRNQNCYLRDQPVACPRIAEGACHRGCVCRENYYRNKNGICVTGEQCDNKNKTNIACPNGEIYNTCPAKPCDADYCPLSRDSSQSCISTKNCGVPRCTCGFNQKRDRTTYQCIGTSSCPPFECNGQNEEYQPCPPVCPGQNCTDYINNSTCPKYRIGIVVPCKPACRCLTGFYRNSQGICVSGCECLGGPPNSCGINEEFSTCVEGVCRNQDCDTKDEPVACPGIAEGGCSKGCVCQENYYRNKNGVCVSRKQCDSQSCPYGEIYNTCPAQPCDADYCPLSRDSPQACISTKNCGVPRCTCGFNQKRDRKTGQCIATSTCPPFECNGQNEEYQPCPPVCPGQNCTDYINNSTCPKYRIGIVVPCKPACRCLTGFYRNSQGTCVSGCECLGDDSTCPLLTTNIDDATNKQFSDGITNFTIKFLQELFQLQSGSNLISSPFSTDIPLSIMGLYTTGIPHDQLLNILKLDDNDQIHQVFKSFLEGVKLVENAEFNLANRVYANEQYPLSNPFLQDTKCIYGAEAENVDFSKPDEAADNINKWVEDNTNNRIKNIVSPDMFSELTRLVLLNAIYYKGTWKYQFNKTFTEDRDFYVTKDNPVKVPTMYLKRFFNYADVPELDAQILELEYESKDFKFLIILPNSIDGLQSTISKLNTDIVNNAITSMRNQTVKLRLPRMEISTTIDLSKILKNLGVTGIFDSSNSGIAGILKNDEPLFVSAAIQKAFLLVNEEGSEAAAANALVVGTTSVGPPEPEVDCNHPFAFFLYYKNDPMFCGVYQNIQ